MQYLTVLKEATETFEEKKSEFIGSIKRVYSEEEARQFIDGIRRKHKEANHNVYAYVIGENRGVQRYSDDGEPQGTGGVPVLEVLKKAGITDAVVVVTRYFGGVLLGAGGLVRAYSKGAALAVKQGGIVEKVKGSEIQTIIDYDLLGKVQYLFNENSWFIQNIDYTDKVSIYSIFQIGDIPELMKQLNDVCSGKVIINVKDEKYYFKLENRLFLE